MIAGNAQSRFLQIRLRSSTTALQYMELQSLRVLGNFCTNGIEELTETHE
jgi:hypothetical protein